MTETVPKDGRAKPQTFHLRIQNQILVSGFAGLDESLVGEKVLPGAGHVHTAALHCREELQATDPHASCRRENKKANAGTRTSRLNALDASVPASDLRRREFHHLR